MQAALRSTSTSRHWTRLKKINECVDQFETLVNKAANLSIPKKKPYFFKFKFSDRVHLLIRHRNYFRNLYKHTLDPSHKSAMNQLNRMVKQEIATNNNESFYERVAQLKLDDNSVFSFTKTLKRKKSIVPPLLNPDQSLAYSEPEKAEALGSAFLATPIKDHPVRQSLTLLSSVKTAGGCPATKQTTSVTPSTVNLIISNLEAKKASGPDGISNRMIKSLPKISVILLTKILNACLRICHFPKAWKLGKVLAFPKPGKAANKPANYRPISLLSCIGKLLEKLILNRLEYFEEEKDIFVPFQFGFRQRHSTFHQTLRITEKISFNFNKNMSTGMVLLDLEKAFD